MLGRVVLPRARDVSAVRPVRSGALLPGRLGRGSAGVDRVPGWPLLPDGHAICDSVQVPCWHIWEFDHADKTERLHCLLARLVLRFGRLDIAHGRVQTRVLLQARQQDRRPDRRHDGKYLPEGLHVLQRLQRPAAMPGRLVPAACRRHQLHRMHAGPLLRHPGAWGDERAVRRGVLLRDTRNLLAAHRGRDGPFRRVPVRYLLPEGHVARDRVRGRDVQRRGVAGNLQAVPGWFPLHGRDGQLLDDTVP